MREASIEHPEGAADEGGVCELSRLLPGFHQATAVLNGSAQDTCRRVTPTPTDTHAPTHPHTHKRPHARRIHTTWTNHGHVT
jgi:hypothetical protein